MPTEIRLVKSNGETCAVAPHRLSFKSERNENGVIDRAMLYTWSSDAWKYEAIAPLHGPGNCTTHCSVHPCSVLLYQPAAKARELKLDEAENEDEQEIIQLLRDWADRYPEAHWRVG